MSAMALIAPYMQLQDKKQCERYSTFPHTQPCRNTSALHRAEQPTHTHPQWGHVWELRGSFGSGAARVPVLVPVRSRGRRRRRGSRLSPLVAVPVEAPARETGGVACSSLLQRQPGRKEAWPARRCPRRSAGPGERRRGLLVAVLVAAPVGSGAACVRCRPGSRA